MILFDYSKNTKASFNAQKAWSSRLVTPSVYMLSKVYKLG